jgi:hypothetical protein
MLVCSERRVLLAGCWWMVYSERSTAGWWLISQANRAPSERVTHGKNVTLNMHDKPTYLTEVSADA